MPMREGQAGEMGRAAPGVRLQGETAEVQNSHKWSIRVNCLAPKQNCESTINFTLSFTVRSTNSGEPPYVYAYHPSASSTVAD